MRFVKLTIRVVAIPFVESFSHSAHERATSDAVIVEAVDELGNAGFGEGLARPYVTGESQANMIARISDLWWPALANREFAALDLSAFDDALVLEPQPGIASDGAARCALTTAMIDCALRREGRLLAAFLPPAREQLVYSGVVTAGDPAAARRHAQQMQLLGLGSIKIKVGMGDDLGRVAAVREAVGASVSLRLDANGAWNLTEAVQQIEALAVYNIASVEQPLPRGDVRELAELKRRVSVPLMADESLLTLDDATALIEHGAVDLFNVRLSKCGGFFRTLAIAHVAAQHGIGIQVGCQVGETAILSAAGRGLAAHLPELAFLEGSFGTLLLTEDLTADAVRFGYGGRAPALQGVGLGIEVDRGRIEKYTTWTRMLNR